MNQSAAIRRRGENLVEGEYDFTQRDFNRIAAMVHAAAGIHLTEAKVTLVYSRLAKRLRALKLETFDDYCDLVDSPQGEDERNNMIAAITTNVTSFFREGHHFEHLRDRVLPALAERARAGGRVRLWSAASSTGQEAYTMGLTILDAIPEAARLDIRILGTDIDPNVIRAAREGVYAAQLCAPIPAALRERFMERDRASGAYRVGPELRTLAKFNILNLIGDWPSFGKFDVIFCRNCVIYFDEPTQERVWNRFKDKLLPGGRIYIGHSERISVPGFVSDGLTVYKAASGGGK